MDNFVVLVVCLKCRSTNGTVEGSMGDDDSYMVYCWNKECNNQEESH